MNYTKGEWKIGRFAGGRIIYVEKDTGDEVICRDVRHYNMNLITAAPDMYEALKDLMFQFATAVEHPYSKDKQVYDKAEKAIAKARGEA